MTDRSQPDLFLQLQMDAICMQFEEQWWAGHRPRIETLMDDHQEPIKSQLLRHLLQIELEYRDSQGEQLDVKEYLDRFPDQHALIRMVHNEHLRSDHDDHGRPSSAAEDVTDPSLSDTDDGNSTNRSVSSANHDDEEHASSAHPLRISHYTVVRKIGQGGMGAVYEAIQDKPRRSVAIKVLASTLASEALVRRFQFESQVLGLLKHPGIAQIFEAGTDQTEVGTRPFFVMELVEGSPLSTFVREQQLNHQRVLELVVTICDAIHHAHQKGIVHRDLKPANILVDNNSQPKILDFGIARTLGSDLGATQQTESGQIVGTLAYMSPEQAEGKSSDIDIRSDVYSLGAILYELLSGQPAFDLRGKSVMESLRLVRETEPPRLATIDRSFSGDVSTIVHAAMEKNRERRYQSATEMAADIRRFLADEPISAHPPSTFYRLKKFARRNKLAVAAATMIALSLVVGMIGTLWQSSVANQEREIATAQKQKADDRLRFFEQMFQSVDPRSLGRDARITDFLDSWEAELQRDQTLDALGRAELLHSLGVAYYGIARYQKSRDALDKAVEIRLAELGKDSSDLAESRAALGLSHLRMGNYDIAKSELDEALRVHEQQLGPSALPVANVLDKLGVIYWFQDDNEKAIRDLRRSLAINRQHLAADDALVIASLHRLATTLGSVGQVEEAEQLVKESLALARKKWPGESIDKNAVEEKYADVLIYLDRWSEADAIVGRLVESNRRLLGPRHPDLAHTIGLHAATKMHLGDMAAAFPLWDEALKIRRSVYGDSHKEIAEALIGTAKTAFETKQIDRAHDDALAAVAMVEKTLGHTSGRLAEALEVLAFACEWKGNRQGALEAQLRTLQIYLDLYGEDLGHPAVATAYSSAGILLLKLGRVDDAESNLRKAIAVADADPLRNRQSFIVARHWLAILLSMRPDARAEYMTVLQEGVEMPNPARREKKLRLQMVAQLGIVLAEDGLFERAIPILEEADEFAEETFGGTPLAFRLSTELGRAYAAVGQLERAEELLIASFIAAERREGTDSPNVQRIRTALQDVFERTDRTPLAAEIKDLVPTDPQPPQLVEPIDKHVVGPQVTLRLGEFEAPHRWVSHEKTRWEIADATNDQFRQVAFDIVSTDQLTALSLAPGTLRPGRKYLWRATYFSSDSRASPTSNVGEFQAEVFDEGIRPIDLSAHFNRDVIASPNDPNEDTFDGDANGLLLAPRFLGEQTPTAETLPPDGRIGIHQLGPYGGFNSIQLSIGDTAPISISLPETEVVSVRFLVASANGGSSLAVSLIHKDGTEKRHLIPCPDWYDDEFTQSKPPYAIPVWNHMDRLSQGNFDDANDPALFEIAIRPGKSQAITGIRLLPGETRFDNPRSKINVFAATGVVQ